MANKRISELTSITGANLADADLLVVVDVSDTTMAASGTNKKITMAELAKDSALTDNLVAKSTLTTNGDLLTRAAGEPARITRADLAADSAFTSRYKPLASDVIWIPAGALGALVGSPVMGTLGNASLSINRQDVLLFDDANVEAASATIVIPVGWTTVTSYFWWANSGAGSGDVRWRFAYDVLTADVTTDQASGDAEVVATAGAQYIAKRTLMNSAQSITAGAPVRIHAQRMASVGTDTLTGDAGLIGIELVRAS